MYLRRLQLKTRARFVGLLVCLLWPQGVIAQNIDKQHEAADQAETSDPCLRDSACNELYENARTLSLAGQYEAALVNYQTAYAKHPENWLLINIGRMQQKTNRSQQAIVTYQRYLALSTGSADPSLDNKARTYLRQAEAEVAAQQPRATLAPTVDTAAGSSRSSDKTPPVYRKWWLWTALGGGIVVATVIGLSVGISNASSVKPRTIPDGLSVYSPTF